MRGAGSRQHAEAWPDSPRGAMLQGLWTTLQQSESKPPPRCAQHTLIFWYFFFFAFLLLADCVTEVQTSFTFCHSFTGGWLKVLCLVFN